MPILRNQRLETVAQELACGHSPDEASRIAGYDQRASSFSPNARKRAARKDVQARLAEIRAPGVHAAEVTTEWMLTKLREFAEYNIDDYLTPPDARGQRFIDISRAPRALLARLSELQQDVTETGKRRRRVTLRRTKIRGYNAIEAIALMAKIKGAIDDPVANAIGGLGERLNRAVERLHKAA